MSYFEKAHTIFADRAALIWFVYWIHTFNLSTLCYGTVHFPIGFTATFLAGGNLKWKHHLSSDRIRLTSMELRLWTQKMSYQSRSIGAYFVSLSAIVSHCDSGCISE